MEGTASQTVLAQHPSVQDLDMDVSRINPRKVHYHKLVINNGPLHEPSEHGRHSVAKKNVPKGQTVKVIRNDANLKAAAKGLLVPSEVMGGVRVVPKKKSATGNIPTTSMPSPLAAMDAEKGQSVVVNKRPSSTHGSGLSTSSNNNKLRLTSDRLAGLSTTASVDAVPRALPPMPTTTLPAVSGPPVPRRPQSIVSSKVSFVATDAESFSVYSCSCCHVKPPSSYAGHASDYDNLTSISQRPSNHPSQRSTVSISSTKLRKLEDDLRREREDRLKTQQDLSTIQQRQQLLLSKLSDDERRRLEELVQGGVE